MWLSESDPGVTELIIRSDAVGPGVLEIAPDLKNDQNKNSPDPISCRSAFIRTRETQLRPTAQTHFHYSTNDSVKMSVLNFCGTQRRKRREEFTVEFWCVLISVDLQSKLWESDGGEVKARAPL